MKDFFVCFCKECKENNKAYHVKLLTDKLTGDVYCYHSWFDNIKKSKHKVNVSTDEKN